MRFYWLCFASSSFFLGNNAHSAFLCWVPLPWLLRLVILVGFTMALHCLTICLQLFETMQILKQYVYLP